MSAPRNKCVIKFTGEQIHYCGNPANCTFITMVQWEEKCTSCGEILEFNLSDVCTHSCALPSTGINLARLLQETGTGETQYCRVQQNL